ncbi:MAG: extracellular solute-binding protein [Erysipelotrichaceae bacterium]|jgi:ABC-type glycerol-3-phosphate transport system substrate-binding protein|nr:extracellular solute-binding protein [Erysipelotrichaceae bacterium]
MKKILLKATLIPILLSGAMLSVTSCGSPKYDYTKADLSVDTSGTTINFWTGFGTDINDVMEDVLDEFTKLTGVNVNYESKGSYDGVLQATQLAATTGQYPNVVIGYPDHFATYVKQDIIARLDHFFEADVHNVFEPEGESFAVSDFYSDYMRENQEIEFDKDGNPYTLGVPFNKSTEVMVYNSTFFDWCASDVGIQTLNSLDIGPITVPTTYAELDSVGKNILALLANMPDSAGGTKGAYDKIVMPDGKAYASGGVPENAILDLRGIFEWGTAGKAGKDCFKPFSYDSQANLFITTVRQSGGTYTYFDQTLNHGYIDFKSQETKAGFTMLKQMYDDNTFGIPGDWDEAKYGSNPFKANKTVMTLGSSAGVANSAPAGNKFKIKAAPVPYQTEDKKLVISQGANLALLTKGGEKDYVASWQLVKFLSKYANGYICSATGYYPSSPFAEQGGMWVGDGVEEYSDYATWAEEAGQPGATMSEQIRSQTAKVNIDHYVNESENWTKFVDTPFAGSADIRTSVAAGPGYIFYETYGTKGNISSVIDGALNQLYITLSSYVKG